MKIIQLIQRRQLRGAEIFACQLSKELFKQGHESILITVFDGGIQLPYDGEIRSLGGSETSRLWDWKAWKRLAQLISTENPDLIQANAGDTLKYAALSKLFCRWRTPIVFRNASTISQYINTPAAKLLNSLFFRFVDFVLSVSEFSRTDFVKSFPVFASKIAVAPIGIGEYPVNKEAFKPPGRPFFVHIGGFTFEKNHRGLISIFKRILLKYPTALLGLVGDGALKPAIEAHVSEEGLNENIIFYGYQPNPWRYLRVADALLLPSVIEGLPSVILESFSFKIPVVAYKVGGIREILMPLKTGWLIDKGDEESFADAACEVIQNNKIAVEFSENAYLMVIEKYSMTSVASRFIDIYEEMTKSN